jgi:Response regulator receiver domain
MCVKVFLADDADVMRKAIRSMLSNRDDISVVGKASDFYETIRKTAELHPDLIILDVNMPDRNRIAPTEVKSLLNGAKVLAITFGVDDRADELKINPVSGFCGGSKRWHWQVFWTLCLVGFRSRFRFLFLWGNHLLSLHCASVD